MAHARWSGLLTHSALNAVYKPQPEVQALD